MRDGAPSARLSIVRPGSLPATAPSGTRARVIASDGYAQHPGYGLTPDRVVSIYRLAEQGWPQAQCDLFADLVEHDGTLRNFLEQRALAVWGKEWSIVPDGAARDTALAAEILDETMRDLAFVDTLAHQLEFNAMGWGATELDWQAVERGEGTARRLWVVPTWLANVEARRFCVKVDTDELRLITADKLGVGEPLERGKWWITRRVGGRVARAGLMRTGAWLALWRRYGTRDWVVALEKYGIPLPLVSYDPTIDDNAKATALEIVDSIGNDGGAAVPKGIEVKIVEATSTATGVGPHGPMLDWSEAELGRLINGGTLATGEGGGKSGGGSYAQARVHASVRWEAVIGDAERIQESFRRCVAEPFMRFNGLSGRAPLLEIQVVRDQAPGDVLTNAVLAYERLGIVPSQSQIRRVLGLRKPLDKADEVPGATAPTGAALPAPKGDQ